MNLFAADEVARQLRLRDMGGIIVVDFIDLQEGENRQKVYDRLRDRMQNDRAKTQHFTIVKIRFDANHASTGASSDVHRDE